MRGLTLTQPWASAVALGSKRIETRSWNTKYRGTIAIHAAKGYKRNELIWLSCCWNWCGALWESGYRMGSDALPIETAIPFGAIVALAELVDVRPTDSFTQRELDTERQPDDPCGHLYKFTERQLGDYSLGRFGFILENIRALATPVPCSGALGLWHVSEAIVEQINQSSWAPV